MADRKGSGTPDLDRRERDPWDRKNPDLGPTAVSPVPATMAVKAAQRRTKFDRSQEEPRERES